MANDDEFFMKEALKEAYKADMINEVPIGAVIVSRGRVIARGHNMTETLNDVTAHAEMLAITSATSAIGGKYLDEATLYVTVEPCPMCATATSWAHIKKIVYGTRDPKKGYSLFSPSLLHPRCDVVEGVLQKECASLVSDFFQRKRK
jgi:tRNA(adenine34) deaminase